MIVKMWLWLKWYAPVSCCGTAISREDWVVRDLNGGCFAVIYFATVFSVDGDVIVVGHFAGAEKCVIF